MSLQKAGRLSASSSNFILSSYTLSGTDADKFEISGTELRFLSAPDFETQSSYQVTVTAGSDAANLTIPITDINEAPSLSLDNSNLAIAENSDNTSSIFIGDVVITDDALGEEELSLSGDDAELFELVNDTELHLVAGTELDYETKSSFDVTVTADDGTFEVPLDITLNLTDVNEAPGGISFDYSNTFPNQVLTLDGDGDYLDTNNTAVNLGRVFTMEAWVKTTGTNQGIIGKGGDNAKGTGSKALYLDSSGRLNFTGGQNGTIYGDSTGKVNDGQWHHIAVVVNNNSGYLYVDGEDATLGELYSSDLADDADHTIKLGFTNYANNLFSGEIDDVRFWNKALSQAEIETSLASGVTGDEDSLVAYYDFEGDNFDDYTFVDNAAITSDRGTITISENIDTTSRVKIADIAIADDALGTNNLSILGDDADLFEIDGTELYLKAGTTLDYETNQYVDITVEVDDDTVGSTPDASIDLRIVVSDRDDAPVISAEVLSNRDSLSEDTDTTERIKIADLTITDVDSPTDANTLSLSGDDADLFELDGMELYLKAGTTLDYETNSSLDVTVEVDDPNLGDSFDNSVDVSISIANANEIFALDYELNNQSLVLDGTGDYVETNAAVLDLTQSDFTVEAWIKTSATEQTIITKNDNDSNDSDEQALYLNSAGQVAFGSGKNGSIIGNTAVNDDQWHHVAVVWDRDAKMGYIYIDGVDDTASTQYTSHLIDSSINTFKIGFHSYSDGRTTNHFSGEIDEIRVWERDLTEIEIYDNFARTTSLSGSEEGLVAYYTFQSDVTEGNTVTDISGNYDATLINDAHIANNNTLEFDSNGISVAENSADTSSVKIADITMLDNTYSTSDLILTGDDADKFIIEGTEVKVKSGTTLDYETDAELDLKIEIDSETTETNVSIVDVLELSNTITELDEETDTTERIKVADFILSENALNNNAIALSGDDADDFEVDGLALYLKAGTTLNYETQAAHNVTVSINNTDGSTVNSAIDFTLNVGDRNDEATDIDFTTNSANFTDNLFLNGDENYIETNAGIVDLSSDFTLETWIQTTATQAQGIITKNDGDNSFEVGERSLLMWSDGRLLYRVRKTNHIHAISGNTSINDGQLHHVAVVWDAAAGEGVSVHFPLSKMS